MSMSFKASPDGTFGEILVNGAVVAKLPVTGNAVIPGLVGTVSQSGGIATGAVVERGSNANGEYVRFADGTQICSASTGGGVFLFTWTFPAAFSAEPHVSAHTHNANLASPFVVHNCQIGVPTVSSVGVRKLYTTYLTPGSYLDATGESVMCVAIGRWF